MPELSLLAALLVGLLGGGHCAGMCGGIITAVSFSMPGNKPSWHLLLAYNLGRVASYTLAGVIAGAVGSTAFFLEHSIPAGKLLYAFANVMLIVLGLYLAGLWHGVVYLEKVGAHLWRRLQPLGKRYLPVRHIGQAAMLGSLWGWLPCGLVYSVLITALASANPVQGGLLMLMFGLGTLPALMLMGMAAVQFKARLQQLWVRRISGGLVIMFGVMGLAKLIT